MRKNPNRFRLLFLCTGNSCRSQMAEGFARARGEETVSVFSAGTKIKPVNPLAVQVMAELGIDISRAESKTLKSLESKKFDVVVTLCGRAAETCPVLPGNPSRVDWNLPDPAGAQGDSEAVLNVYRQTRDEIRCLVDGLFDRGYLQVLTHAKRQADLILDNMPEGVLAHDMQRKIFYFNRAAEKMTGYAREEVIGHDCHDVFPNGFCGDLCDFRDSGKPPLFDAITRSMEINTKSGEKRHVKMHIKTMYDARNRAVGVLTSIKDNTHELELERRLGETDRFSGIVGRDPKMLEVYELISDLADSNASVLIQGESGTGKELVAAAIHREGIRAQKLFVPINCGALPEGLLESELFGHVRGAFTGAIRDKKGRFELADGGTIFLDEIADISPAMQVKLLRVLQEGTFERVGSEKTIKVDVRVICATNRDLHKTVREDLYYRLCVAPIYLPPLRERRGDIPLLANHILSHALEENKRGPVTLSSDVINVMFSYEWPGNVRELQNWIQFALFKCKDEVILPEHLPTHHTRKTSVTPHLTNGKRRRKRKLAVDAVEQALAQTKGNKLAAARELGVSRATLYRFLDDNKN